VSYSVLAKRYAKAIHELGYAKELSQQYHQQLESFSQSINQDHGIKTFFSSTAVSKETKKEILKKVFSATKLESEVQAFLALLIDKGRFSALEDIVSASRELIDQGHGTTRGKIYSAQSLGAAVIADYENKISKIMNKKIQLEAHINANILGGAKIEVGGWTFDDSLETHMSQLIDNILNKSN